MVILWLYYGYTIVIRLLYDCYTIVIRLLYDGYTMVIRWLYDGYTMVIRWLYGGYTMVIRWLYDGYTVVIRWLYGGYTMVIRWLYDVSTPSGDSAFKSGGIAFLSTTDMFFNMIGVFRVTFPIVNPVFQLPRLQCVPVCISGTPHRNALQFVLLSS